MYIQEISIDGFKSYASRTVVRGFDAQFNAITGLNGSGKSNILDSICFVLGITNLSQVRVGNLTDLVYKSGQAGVTKATVTILFNNTDKSVCPVGYEHYDEISVTRQLVIGGKNKYLVNGHTVQASQVQNLFHSVQLNVNNPHFLIMQGRITKVLNMKPPEILGMLEEAAGTRMFENKKQSAIKTIEKKAAKMCEIQKVLQSEITPTLERLRGEKRHYLKWSANNLEIEKLQRLCIAYTFSKAQDEILRSADELKGMEEQRNKYGEEIEKHKAAVVKREKEVQQLLDLRDREYEIDLRKAKKNEEALSKELVQITSVYNNKKTSADKEEQALQCMSTQAGDAQSAVETKRQELQASEISWQEVKMALDKKENEVREMTKSYQDMCAGLAQEDETGEVSATLTDQVASARQASQEAQGKADQFALRINHLQKAIGETRKELKKSEKEGQKVEGERTDLTRSIKGLRTQLEELGIDVGAVDGMHLELRTEEAAIECLKQQVEMFSAQLEGRLAFEYKTPEAGFDHRRVKGLIAKLIELKDASTATAIEVVAGSKLFQVVTDTEQTGKLLLQKGALRKRITIIPLNRIAHNVLDPQCLSTAQQLAVSKGGKAHLALELIGFENEIRAAMEYVFGTTLVCDSLDVAKSLAFDKAVHRRTVTIQGDSFDPSGTLTGGSNQQIGIILSKLQELSTRQIELNQKVARVAELSAVVTKQATLGKEYNKVSAALDMKQHELSLLEERASQSIYAMHAAQLAELETRLAEAEESLRNCKAAAATASAKHKELARAETGLRKEREAKLTCLEKSLETARKAHTKAEAAFKSVEQQHKMLQLELKGLHGETSTAEDQLSSSRQGISKLREELQRYEEQVKIKRQEYDAASNVLAEAKKQVAVCDKQVMSLQTANSEAGKLLSSIEIEAKRLASKLSRFQKDKHTARKTVQQMLSQHPWIEREKQFFGRAQTDYDFEAKNPARAQTVLGKLQDEQQHLAKTINKKVLSMIEKVEGDYDELIEKLKVIENDKDKIQSVIEELNVKKNEALQTTWRKVNRDFGSIFTTLLPGTSAMLEPCQGQSVLEGLEVKVAFGSVWKESLTELSGGQRSLLALSLILSLLLFKPAPMYILDEVDAALDLSHTQNIGAMLRTHFKQSQFIVVSLKEGMFNNANVIFRTRFVDGLSTVTRTLGASNKLTTADARLPTGAEAKRKKIAGRGIENQENTQ